MADHTSDFFLEVGTLASSGSTASDHLFAFRLGAVAALTSSNPPAHSGSANLDAPAAPPLHRCPLPSPFPPDQPSPPDQPDQPPPRPVSAGSLSYDGHYLDYTQDDITPAVTGLIERIDPVTCRPATPLRPPLPGDPTSRGAPLIIWQLTYDARYAFRSGHQGALLVLATARGYGGPDPFPIYAVDPLTGAVELALELPPGFSAYMSFYVFSYDVSDDALWVWLGGGPTKVAMPTVHGRTATAVDTCMSHQSPFGEPEGPYATLLAVADGGMYVQLEDDTTVLHGDDRSCTIHGGFVHTRSAEPRDEDEQIACDPITNGDAVVSPRADGPRTTLLWLHESVGNAVSAYAIPDGFCPFPTTLALLPSRPVPVGMALTLCAVLRRATADRIPIPDQTVSFRIDGKPAGAGRTDETGRACTTTTAPLIAGWHRADAHFGGTPISFLPSSAEGPLLTYAQAAMMRIGPVAPPLVAETPPLPPPQPVPQAQVAEQAQAESQLQAQAQTQTVTQAQPGVMVQRQRQVKVATEMLPTRLRQPAYQASALRPGRQRVPATPVAVLAAMLLLGVGLVARRPALLRARIRRRR